MLHVYMQGLWSAYGYYEFQP